MVSSLLADALSNPTASLIGLFDTVAALDEFPAKVTAHFSGIFNSLDTLNEIPTLDLQNPPESCRDRSLVQFRAMVQDTSQSPEMYLAKLTGGKCGGWGLVEDDAAGRDGSLSDEINYADLRECAVVWAITIPGESLWCSNAIDDGTGLKMTARKPPLSHKFSIPGAPHIGVQVKIYDNSRSELLKTADLFTFVGILTSEPLHAHLDQSDTIVVSTLHVLFSQPMQPTIVPRIYPFSPGVSVGELRSELIAWIADEGLAGDREAGEWVLLCAIARVQSRSPPILPPSLTISRFPSYLPDSNITPQVNHPTPTLSHVLSYIFPMLSTIPLSLHTLNTTSFAPESKDEDLHSGWLQLPKGTICVVTEGGVTEGGVAERGMMNIRAIQEMMNAQQLNYVFPYSRFSFDTDVGFLVLSEGRKSAFFQTNINVPLRPKHATTELYKEAYKITLPSKEKLDMFRALVGSAKVGNVSIGENTAEHIQEEFVRERKTGSSSEGEGQKAPEGYTSDDLVHRILVARLMALLWQESEISVDVWDRMKILEAKRKSMLESSS